jgi:hypothetical protein
MAHDERQSFWHTLPGILTATAGLLTAVTALYIAVVQNRSDEPESTPPAVETVTATRPGGARERAPTETSPPPQGTAGDPPVAPGGGGAAAPKPWAESDALLTMTDGSETTVRSASLSNCISVHHSITLASGQEIMFDRMRSLEVVRSDASGSSSPRATIVVTLLDGRAVNGTMDAGCGWFGYNDIGRFDFTVDRLRRVDFQR